MRGRISAIGSPAYSGEFTRIDVPSEIPVGDDIVITVDGYVEDPSKSWADFWSGAFTAEGNNLRDCTVFRGTGVKIGPEIPIPKLSLGKMPDYSVDITLRVWGNEAYWNPGRPPGF
jgi:hypothetical protein